MIIRNISVRTKLLLTTLIVVLVLVVLTLIFADASNRLDKQAILLKDRSELNSGFLSLQTNFYSLAREGGAGEVALFLQELHQVEEQIHVVLLHETTAQNESIVRTGNQILSLLDRF